MTVVEKVELISEKIKPKIGSRVLNSREELLSGEIAQEINDLIQERGVLVFPEINFTDEEQDHFTETLGALAVEDTLNSADEGELAMQISLDPAVNPEAAREYLKGAFFWHIDGTMNKKLPGLAILCSKVLPTWGGNTEFCNTYAAYDELSAEKKKEIDGLRTVHAMWNTLFYYEPEANQQKLEQMMSIGHRDLPLVWTHDSGRKSLILGNTAHHIKDIDWEESTRLLNGLREWATSEPFHYSHEWKAGDAVMWDNSGTMHRARPYDPDCGRLLRRTKTAGIFVE